MGSAAIIVDSARWRQCECLPVMTISTGLYHVLMTTINLPAIIDLIPESKRCDAAKDAVKSEFEPETVLDRLLSNPLDFPPLHQAILAEDTVCIVLEPGIPHGHAIAAGMARAVSLIGVAAERISILLGEGTAADVVADLGVRLGSLGFSEVNVVVHDSTQRESIGFLGPGSSGDPITLNARLVHADFVIPIAGAKSCGWKSQIDFLYPYFSDVDSQKRFFHLNLRKRIAFNEEVTRWLGATFLVGNLPSFPMEGSRQSEHSIFLGEQKSVTRMMSKCIQEKRVELPLEEFDLVIAEVNPHLCLSNEELNDTVQQVSQWCSHKGTILLVWNNQLIIPRLIENQSRETGFSSNPVAELGGQSLFVLSEQPLLSGLGMTPVVEINEIKRLIDQHENILVIRDFPNDFGRCKNADLNTTQ